MEDALWTIAFILLLILVCKDMSGKSQLNDIKIQLKRIADKMEEDKN